MKIIASLGPMPSHLQHPIGQTWPQLPHHPSRTAAFCFLIQFRACIVESTWNTFWTFGRSDYRELSPFRHDQPGQDLIIGRRLLVGRYGKIEDWILNHFAPIAPFIHLGAGHNRWDAKSQCRSWVLVQTAAAILKHSCHSKQAIHQNGSLWKGDWLVIGASLQFLAHHPNLCNLSRRNLSQDEISC